MPILNIENEQVILGPKGKPEYVILPIARYQQLMRMLEDYGLGQAILAAEAEPRYRKSEALALLESEERPESTQDNYPSTT